MRFLLIIIAMLFMDTVVLAQTTITAYYKDFDWVAMRPIGKKVNKKTSHYPIKVLMSQDSNILEVQYLKYRKVEFDQSRRNYPYFKRVIGHNTYLPIYLTNLTSHSPGQYLIPINDTTAFILNPFCTLTITSSKRLNTLTIKEFNSSFIDREVIPLDFFKDYPNIDMDTTMAWRKDNTWWNLDKLQYIKKSFSNFLQLNPTDIYSIITYSYKNARKKRLRITKTAQKGTFSEYPLPLGRLFKQGSLFNYSIFSGML